MINEMKWIKLYHTNISHQLDENNDNETTCGMSLMGPLTEKNIPNETQPKCKRCLRGIKYLE